MISFNLFISQSSNRIIQLVDSNEKLNIMDYWAYEIKDKWGWSTLTMKIYKKEGNKFTFNDS